ncbi:Lcl domain-containing protein [Parabacteroides sp.]
MILLLAGLAAPALHAQTVSTVMLKGSMYPVIDLESLAPLGCVLTRKEADARRETMHALVVSGDKKLDDNGSWNQKMSAKYQVMKNDLFTDKKVWVDAWNGCKNYDGSADGGTSQQGLWRLPNERELQMILILHPLLVQQKLITPFQTTYYWCSIEHSATQMWCVDFNSGFTDCFQSKASTYPVRCIRDL